MLFIIFLLITAIWLLCYVRIAQRLLSSPKKRMRLFSWVLPLISVFLADCVLASPVGQTDGSLKGGAVFAIGIVLMMFAYYFHFLLWGYVFRCVKCGATENTSPFWWRKGVHWCPGCKRPYINGRTNEDTAEQPVRVAGFAHLGSPPSATSPSSQSIGARADQGLKRRLLWVYAPPVPIAAAALAYFLYMVGSFALHGVYIYQTKLNIGRPIEISFADSPLLFAALSTGQLALAAFAAGWGIENAYHVLRILRPSLGWPLRPAFKPYRVAVLFIWLWVILTIAWICYFGVTLALST